MFGFVSSHPIKKGLFVLLPMLKSVFIVFLLVGSIPYVTAADTEIDFFELYRTPKEDRGLPEMPACICASIIKDNQHTEFFGMLQKFGKEQIPLIDFIAQWADKQGPKYPVFKNFVLKPYSSHSEHYVRSCFISGLDFLMSALPLFSKNPDIEKKISENIEHLFTLIVFEKAEEEEESVNPIAAVEPSNELEKNSGGVLSYIPNFLGYNKSKRTSEEAGSPGLEKSSGGWFSYLWKRNEDKKDLEVPTLEADDTFKVLEEKGLDPDFSSIQGAAEEKEKQLDLVLDALKIIVQINFKKDKSNPPITEKYWQDYLQTLCSTHKRKLPLEDIGIIVSSALHIALHLYLAEISRKMPEQYLTRLLKTNDERYTRFISLPDAKTGWIGWVSSFFLGS